MATATKFTYADYLELPEDGKRYEIIDGELLMNPSPLLIHQAIANELSFLLNRYLHEHPIGVLYQAPTDVVLSDEDVVIPDLIFIRNERKTILRNKNIQGAPDLVIEVLSDSTRKRDEIEKRKLYERFGVFEYWIVDPVVETIKIHRADPSGRYVRAAELSKDAGDLLTSSLLPGFSATLAQIFPDSE